jgi:hypothetical protein
MAAAAGSADWEAEEVATEEAGRVVAQAEAELQQHNPPAVVLLVQAVGDQPSAMQDIFKCRRTRRDSLALTRRGRWWIKHLGNVDESDAVEIHLHDCFLRRQGPPTKSLFRVP